MTHIDQKSKFKDTFEKIYDSTWTIWIILAVGILIHIIQYIANRSLWLDEAMLSSNIVNRTLFGMLQHLDYAQGAPVGFLILEKLAVLSFGSNEYSLRLFPLLSGVISLFIFYKVSSIYIRNKAVPFAVLLFSISYPLIRYSSEVKQYSTDVLIALILYLTAAPFFSEEKSNRIFFIFGIVGALSIWLSFPSVFVLAGLGTVIFAMHLHSGEWKEVKKLLVIYLFWSINFSIFYYFFLHDLSSHKYLLKAWEKSFAPFPLTSIPQFKWYLNYFYFGNFKYLFGSHIYLIAAFLFLIGFSNIFIEKNIKLIAIFSPIVFLLIASALRKYPGGDRLALFLISPIILITSEGAIDLISKYSGNIAVLVIAIFLTFFLYPFHDALKTIKEPIKHEEIKPSMKYLSENLKKDDTVYIYYGAVQAFKFYLKEFNIDKKKCISGSISARKDWEILLEEIEKLRGKKRVWFLFSHVYNKRGVNEKQFVLFHLNRTGKSIESQQYKGASVYLYDLNGHKISELKDP
jgi:hypothetical protein